MEVVSEFFQIWVVVQHLWLTIRVMNKTEWLSLKLILLLRHGGRDLLWTIQKIVIHVVMLGGFVGGLSRCLFIVIGGLLQQSILGTLVDLTHNK